MTLVDLPLSLDIYNQGFQTDNILIIWNWEILLENDKKTKQ